MLDSWEAPKSPWAKELMTAADHGALPWSRDGGVTKAVYPYTGRGRSVRQLMLEVFDAPSEDRIRRYVVRACREHVLTPVIVSSTGAVHPYLGSPTPELVPRLSYIREVPAEGGGTAEGLASGVGLPGGL